MDCRPNSRFHNENYGPFQWPILSAEKKHQRLYCVQKEIFNMMKKQQQKTGKSVIVSVYNIAEIRARLQELTTYKESFTKIMRKRKTSRPTRRSCLFRFLLTASFHSSIW